MANKKTGTASSALDKIRLNSTIKNSALVSESVFFDDNRDIVQTSVPAINIALSGDLDGGFVPGITLWCGPSKHFKTLFALIMAKAYMDKYPESAMIYWDNEYGTPKAYFQMLDFDMGRILHCPLVNIEQLKHDAVNQFTKLNRGDKVISVIDSIGNLASKNELDNAIKGKEKLDMTRAKALKSLFRMVTPYVNINDVPLEVVNHTYKTQETYSKDVVSGGTGPYYSADNVFIIGRQQVKQKQDDKEIIGWQFIIKVDKSRFVREKSRIPITVRFEGGVSKYSGLLDMAVLAGVVVKPKDGFYSRVDSTTCAVEKEQFRARATDTDEFWNPILNDHKFSEWVKDRYKLSSNNLFSPVDETIFPCEDDGEEGEDFSEEENDESDSD